MVNLIILLLNGITIPHHIRWATTRYSRFFPSYSFSQESLYSLVREMFKGREFSILVDNGSTHNFLDENAASHLY